MYKILLYEDARGNSPFENFIAELNEKAQTDKRARGLLKKVHYCLAILAEGGTRAGEKFTKHIEGKLWELRPDDHRVFFFLWSGNHQAKREMDDWVSRYGQ